MKFYWINYSVWACLLFCVSVTNSQGENQLDLVFVIDSSDSIGEQCFYQLRQAVVDYVNELPVAEDMVNIGVVSYSTTWRVIPLTGDKEALVADILALPYLGDLTQTERGLLEAQNLLQPRVLSRPGAPKAVYLATDGTSRFPSESKRVADDLRNASRASVWAVGVGNDTMLLELIDIALSLSYVRTTQRCDVLPRVPLGVDTISPTATTTAPTTTILQPSGSVTVNPTPLASTQTLPITQTMPSTWSTSGMSMTPTAVQSTDGMFSTVYPGTDDRNLGDGSVWFNSSDTDGLCYQAVALQGYGYNPHPQDCDKYLKCHKSDNGTVTAAIKFCAMGLFWNQDTLTCVEPGKSCCPDPCKYKDGCGAYSMNRECGLYWECKNGVSTAQSCKSEYAYVAGHECVYTPRCKAVNQNSTCGEDTKLNTSTIADDANCRYKAFLDPRPFVNGTIFNNTRILCSPSNNTCYSLVKVDYDSTRPLSIHFRYRSSTNRRRGYMQEVLLRSAECSMSSGLFVVSDDSYNLNVRVMSPHGYALSATVPLWGLNGSEWKEVSIQYIDGTLAIQVTVANLTYTYHVKSGFHVQVGVCGWDIGNPGDLWQSLASYTGSISEILISRCQENES